MTDPELYHALTHIRSTLEDLKQYGPIAETIEFWLIQKEMGLSRVAESRGWVRRDGQWTAKGFTPEESKR
jgi:hypothetical protein